MPWTLMELPDLVNRSAGCWMSVSRLFCVSPLLLNGMPVRLLPRRREQWQENDIQGYPKFSLRLGRQQCCQ